MSVSNENVKETYNGNGSTIYWPITFEYADPNHIAVYLTDDDGVTGDKLESDYTVDEENERVIYPDPFNEELILPEGWKITLKRETPLIQNYQPSTQSFNPADIEPALDKTMMAIAEIKEENSRTIKANITEDGADYTLPSPAQGLVVGWDLTDGTRLVNYTNPGAAAAEAEAFAAEAEAFAAEAAGSATTATEAEEAIRGIVYHGWVSGLTAVYVSSNKIKIEGLDVTDRIQKGTKIRYKQGGDWKYGVVFANVTFATDTTISLTGGSDFTVANAPITDFGFSNIENPVGWPGVFNYNLQWTAATSNPEISNGTIKARFNVIQQRCSLSVSITMGSTTTYGSGIWSFSLPIPARAYASAIVTASDQGTSYRTGSVALFEGGTIKIRNLSDGSEWGATVPHTWAGSDHLGFDLEYFI